MFWAVLGELSYGNGTQGTSWMFLLIRASFNLNRKDDWVLKPHLVTWLLFEAIQNRFIVFRKTTLSLNPSELVAILSQQTLYVSFDFRFKIEQPTTIHRASDLPVLLFSYFFCLLCTHHDHSVCRIPVHFYSHLIHVLECPTAELSEYPNLPYQPLTRRHL